MKKVITSALIVIACLGFWGCSKDIPTTGTTDTAGDSIVIEWISIPAGNFTMGSLSTDPYAIASEQPQQTVYLDAYQISKYEITNRQYNAFMDSGGYSTQSYWSDSGWAWKTTNNITEPACWTAGTYNSGTAFPNHPVVAVSWYEADAFCRWAGGHLPTEAQWEKAARGTDVRYYPWGSTWDGAKCNSYDSTAPDTFTYSSPVGFFPAGISYYGVCDMAGNVLEWVNDWYVTYQGSSSPFDYTGTARVLRGGSFYDNDDNCRVANRYAYHQSSRHYDSGFRVAK